MLTIYASEFANNARAVPRGVELQDAGRPKYHRLGGGLLNESTAITHGAIRTQPPL
jgi:hypothetical protein